jgi:hypothetical protein
MHCGILQNGVRNFIFVMMKKPTKQQVEELNHLVLLPDEAIDTSDIPEKTNWENAVIGRFYTQKTKTSIEIEP